MCSLAFDRKSWCLGGDFALLLHNYYWSVCDTAGMYTILTEQRAVSTEIMLIGVPVEAADDNLALAVDDQNS